MLWSADRRPREFSITHYPAARVVLSTTTSGAELDDDPLAAPFPASQPTPPGPAAAPTLLRSSHADLHMELRAAIREGIPAGSRPVEADLARTYGAARSTMKQVLAQLHAGGTLVRRNGHTIVARSPPTGSAPASRSGRARPAGTATGTSPRSPSRSRRSSAGCCRRPVTPSRWTSS
ncbi:hypothetical protein [Pseudonocardia sp. NPDC046786]|uniref:hypothetical protein n=1 Tax=Pseudonocardia sp. NPDC046786 TaxID=3155471 RepID=UPI0033E0E7AB